MARIIHPIPSTGILRSHFGVVFTDGVADVDLTGKPNLRHFYETRGYGIDESVHVSKAALQGQATELGIEWKPRWTIAELEQAISEHAVDEDPLTGYAIVEMADGTVVGDGTTLATLPSAPNQV